MIYFLGVEINNKNNIIFSNNPLNNIIVSKNIYGIINSNDFILPINKHKNYTFFVCTNKSNNNIILNLILILIIYYQK